MGQYRRSILAIACALVQLLAIRGASADSALQKAQKHFRQGQAYFKVGTFDKAIEEYEAAYSLAPKPGVLFNIGLCHENAGDDEKAVEFYERYLRDAPNADKATEARARREALARGIAERKRDAKARNEAQAKRAAGQAALDTGAWDAAIALLTASYALHADPEVVFELAEAYTGQGEPILAKAEYERYLREAPTGSHRQQAARRIAEFDAASGEPDRALDGTREPNAKRVEISGAPSLVPSIVAFSVAGLAGAVGVVFGLQASDVNSELGQALDDGAPPLDTGDSRFSEGKRKALIANISYATAGVATLVGAYLVRRYMSSEKASKGGQALLVPTASSNHAGFALEVTF